MLVIHWSPVKNTKTILKRGIRKGKRGVFCFPLTGHRSVDRWWAQAFRSYWRPRTQYNGFVFRVAKADLPAKFCDWVVEPFTPSPIYTEVHELELAIKATLLWRLENNWDGPVSLTRRPLSSLSGKIHQSSAVSAQTRH